MTQIAVKRLALEERRSVTVASVSDIMRHAQTHKYHKHGNHYISDTTGTEPLRQHEHYYVS